MVEMGSWTKQRNEERIKGVTGDGGGAMGWTSEEGSRKEMISRGNGQKGNGLQLGRRRSI